MIKSVEIRDFESHEHTVLKFGPSFNVVHGTSNVGKSSVFRAMSLPAYGEWAGGEDRKHGKTGPVRAGKKFCVVRVTSDRGYVETKKGTGVNEWEVHDDVNDTTKNLKSPGAGSVPEAQAILGLSELDIAGLKVRLNWSNQRDKHFLLDEVEGKSASPSLVAAVLDEVAGISGFEGLVRELANEKTTCEKQVKKLNEEVERLDTELSVYIDLDELLNKTNEALRLLDEADRQQLQLTEVEEIHVQWTNVSERLRQVQEQLRAYMELEDQERRLKQADRVLSECNDARERLRQLNELTTQRDRLGTLIVSLRNRVTNTKSLLDETGVRLEKLNELTTRYVAYDELRTSWNDITKKLQDTRTHPQVDVITLERRLEEARKHQVVLAQTISMNTDLSKLSQDVQRTTTRLSNACELLQQSTKEYKTFVKNIHTCPIIDAPFPESCRERLREEVK